MWPLRLASASGPLDLGFAADIRRVSALIGLNILKPAGLIPDGIELSALGAAMGGTMCFA
jgi:hypothetical protein